MQNARLERISVPEAKGILHNTRITGRRDGAIFPVTEAIGERFPALPIYRLTINNPPMAEEPNPKVHFWLTTAYQLAPNDPRVCITAFVGENEHATKMRSFYLSQSLGLWRVLPFYFFDPQTGEENHYGKGYFNDDVITIPELQRSFAEITSRHNQMPSIKNGQRLFFAGSFGFPEGNVIYSQLDLNQNLPSDQRYLEQVDFVQEVQPFIKRLKGNFYPRRMGLIRIPPEELLFDADGLSQKPDFSKKIAEWQQFSPMYGMINTTVFHSVDGDYGYLFNKIYTNQAWIAAVFENNQPVTTLGVPRISVGAGNLATGKYEHTNFYDKDDALDGFGTPVKIHPRIARVIQLLEGNGTTGKLIAKLKDQGLLDEALRDWGYADMGPKYLSQVPLIQEFQNSKNCS